jgi:hypothetical protein
MQQPARTQLAHETTSSIIVDPSASTETPRRRFAKSEEEEYRAGFEPR